MRTIAWIWVMLASLLQAGGLKFEKTLIDLPLAPDAANASADFTFTNESGQPVTILNIEKTCSCLVAQMKENKLTYQPGEKGTLQVTFEVGNFSGVTEKTVILHFANEPADKPITLTVRCHIPVIVELDHKTLQWPINSKPTPQKVDIQIKHTKPIHILKTTCSAKQFTIELKTLKDGTHYELWITPTDMQRPQVGIIRLETDCEIKRHHIQQVFAMVMAERPKVAVIP